MLSNMEKKIRVIALDLDGTLTNEKKEIPVRTFRTLMAAQEQGIRLILASGRPPYGMEPLCRQLQMERYGGMMLAYNGGHIEDCSTGRTLVEVRLDEAFLPEMHECQKQSGMTLMTYYGDKIYTENPGSPYVQQSSRNNKMQIVQVSDFVSDTPRPINKCLMVGPPEIVPEWEERWKRQFEDRMHIMHSTPYFIEFLPLGIDKGIALSRLLPQLGMTTDNLMTFGDSHNDISMLRYAGIGVAMDNAEPEVKAAADYVTDSNEHDGVATAIYHYGVVDVEHI